MLDSTSNVSILIPISKFRTFKYLPRRISSNIRKDFHSEHRNPNTNKQTDRQTNMQLHPKTRVPLILTSGSSHHHHQTNSISCDSSSLSSASSMSYPTLETTTQREARGRLTNRRQAQRMITSRASRSNRCCSYINNNNNFSSLLKSESITSHNSPKKSQHQSTMTQMPNTKQTKLRPIPRAKLAMSSLTLVVLLALSSTIMFLSSSSVFQAQGKLIVKRFNCCLFVGVVRVGAQARENTHKATLL